jgi:hypothetical protein
VVSVRVGAFFAALFLGNVCHHRALLLVGVIYESESKVNPLFLKEGLYHRLKDNKWS